MIRRKVHEFSTAELSMRVLKRAEPMVRKPDFLMGDVVDVLRREFSLSRAQGYRLVHTVMDICGVHYESNAARKSRAADKTSAAVMFARSNQA